jgi:voltage-gated potassium channel
MTLPINTGSHANSALNQPAKQRNKMDNPANNRKLMENWRRTLYNIIFEADTPGGKMFDIALLWAILLSVFIVIIDSVASIKADYGTILHYAEWFFTILFTVEYLLRLFTVPRPLSYVLSMYGIVDLTAFFPTYLSLFFSGGHALLVIRSLRLLRVFRILKLSRYMGEADILRDALRASRIKITVFLYSVVIMVIIIGSVMYLVEGPENGFSSIPVSIYWAVVTLTTVGYGDIYPATVLGQVLASLVMILGFGIIAIPTGIVSVELATASKSKSPTNTCPHCLTEGHDHDAVYCKYCGGAL